MPQLDSVSNIPIVLKFTDTPLKTILDAVSKASGINFLYDEKAETTKRVTVDFSKVDLSQVLDYLMMQTKHFYKVLDSHTVIVVPDSKQKRDEYQDQVIRTFYLSNADAKDVFQLVRSILQAKKMAMNQDLNSITIEDSPEVVAICQRIIEDNDKCKGEIVVDILLLEVAQNWERHIGIDLSQKGFTIGPKNNLTVDSNGNPTGFAAAGSSGTGGPPVPLNELGNTLSHGLWIGPVPNFVVNLLMTDNQSQVLAKPQLRVMEGQKASVHIGQKLPIANATQYLGTSTGTTNYTPSVSYTYIDIGVKIEIEPKVHHNKEVTIKLKAEVTSHAGDVKPPTGSLTGPQPILGTRDITTVIRLQDGETSLMAGLIEKDESNDKSGTPGLSEIPGLGRLFSDTDKTKNTTDVVMMLTPHILRMPNITEDDVKAVWVGTADHPSLKDFGSSTFAKPAAPAEQPPAAKPEEKAPEKQPAKVPEKQAEKPAEKQPEKPAEKPAEKQPDQPQKAAAGQPAAQPAAQTVKLIVSPANADAKQGDAVVLNMVLVGAKELKSVHAEMDFPTDLLQFQGADEGTFFKLGGAPTSFVARETKPGLIAIDLARTDGSGAVGSGLMARVRFTALKAGIAKANFGTGQGVDASGNATPLSPAVSVISVAAAPPPPAAAGAKGE